MRIRPLALGSILFGFFMMLTLEPSATRAFREKASPDGVARLMAWPPTLQSTALPALENGVPFDSWADSYTYENLYIEVPAGASKLTVTLTNGSGDLDLLLRYANPMSATTYDELVGQADFVSDSYSADESIEVSTSSNPPLQHGHWYICVINLNNYYTTYTVTAKYTVSSLALENGVPFNTSLGSMSFQNYTIDVPAGSNQLTVTLANGTGNLDLYLKYGSRISGGTVTDLEEDADFRSTGPTSDEKIEITLQSSPPLQQGTWYIATLNLNDSTTPFTLTAAYQLSGAPLTRKPQLVFGINEPFIVPWGDVRITCRHEGLSASNPGDLYVALADPETGTLLFFQENAPATATAVPFKTNIAASEGEILLLDLKLGEVVPEKHFVFYGALLQQGAPLVQASFLSDIAMLNVFLTNLSKEQSDTLSDKGIPPVYSIRFDHAAGRRYESWLYSSDRVYTFHNGVLLSKPNEGVPRNASSANLAAGKAGPHLFFPTMNTDHLTFLFGEPDHLVQSGAPGRETWVYDDIGLRVTLVNGRIFSVEVG